MASFNNYLPLLQQVEGGYTDHPHDNGNWTGGKQGVGNLVGTNYGISAPVYKKWLDREPTVADMKAITKDVAKEIFKAWFWIPSGGQLIHDQSVANIIADHAVNAGTGSAGRLVQRVLNDAFGFSLAVDGAIGKNTIAAINSVDPMQLHEEIKKARERFYISLNQPTFTRGWLNRLSNFVYEKKKVVSVGVAVTFIAGFGIYLLRKRIKQRKAW